MVDYKEILRLYDFELSQRQITSSIDDGSKFQSNDAHFQQTWRIDADRLGWKQDSIS